MRVAIVSYYTPPQPAIASHRVLRITRALLAAGHDVHWVTADAARFRDDYLDPTLGALVPDSVVVHGLDGQALITKPAAEGLVEKIKRTVAWHLPRKTAWPDSFVSWARKLKQHLPRFVRELQIDAIFVCCSPHSQILALPAVRRSFPKLKIFVDYRDLLSGNPWNAPRSPRVAARKLALERRVLQSVDVLFVNTASARERFLEVVGEIPGLAVEVMRNAADFDLADEVARDGRSMGSDTIDLGFFGTVFPRRRLRPVLDAIATLPEDAQRRLRIHVYCDRFDSARLLDEDLAAVPEPVAALVQRHDLLPYGDALRTMRAMDVLLLVNGPEASDAVFVPGKLYDYLMARRPVLFVGHAGEAAAIIARTSGADWCFDTADTAAIATRLASLADRQQDLPPVDEFAPGTAFQPLLHRLEETVMK